MGNFVTINMEEIFRKNQEFITEINTIKMERQLQMQNQIREREEALKLAHVREFFYWYAAFYASAVAYFYNRYQRLRHKSVLFPIVPLTLLLAYQSDWAYGTKNERIKAEAERIIQFESQQVELPLGLPTASDIDQGRLETERRKKLNPHPHITP